MGSDKPKSTKSGDNHKKSGADIRFDSEDFSTSMARLAELAAKDIIVESKDDKQKDLEAEALKEYLTPKRKKKTEGEEKEDRSGKVRVNPYMAIGLLVVVMSVGFMAIPKIVSFLEEDVTKPDAKRQIAQRDAAQDKKMNTYSLGDAVKDIQKKSELKSMSVAELAKQVEQTNTELGYTGEGEGWSSLFNTNNSVQLSGDGATLTEPTADGEIPTDDHEVDQFYAVELKSPDESLFDAVNVATWEPTEFDWASDCFMGQIALNDSANQVFYLDIYKAMKITALPAGSVNCN